MVNQMFRFPGLALKGLAASASSLLQTNHATKGNYLPENTMITGSPNQPVREARRRSIQADFHLPVHPNSS